MSKLEIWKYQFPTENVEHVNTIPAYARPIHYALQKGVPTVWYELNPDRPSITHHFRFIMTGEPFEMSEYTRDNYHVGTFIIDWLVIHLYDLTPLDNINEPYLVKDDDHAILP